MSVEEATMCVYVIAFTHMNHCIISWSQRNHVTCQALESLYKQMSPSQVHNTEETHHLTQFYPSYAIQDASMQSSGLSLCPRHNQVCWNLLLFSFQASL